MADIEIPTFVSANLQKQHPPRPRNGAANLAASQFKPGESGNPGGKPVGARNRLNASFLAALSEQFDKHGKEAIEAVAKNDPSTFMRVLAGILPKEVELTKQMDEVTDEQLDAAAVAIRAILAAQDSGAAASKAKKPKSTV